MTIIVKIMPKPIDPDFNPLVVALAYDGLCTFEYAIAVEAFGLDRPEMGPDWYRFQTAAIENGPLRMSGGVRMLVDGGMDLLEEAGTIVVPGWKRGSQPVPSALVDQLRRAHDRGARIISICSGVFVLAAAGLLDGREATTHWMYTEKLAELPGVTSVPDVLYVDNGQVLTSAGSAAGLDLCLHLIRRDYGAEAANNVARRMVVAPHRDGGQAQFIPRPVPEAREADRLSPLLDRMRGRLDQEMSVDGLAAEAGMSRRTFIRRFKDTTGTSPADWIRGERLARARELLERSSLGMEEIAALCGFGSTATLRHHFRQKLSTTPTAYRERFASPEQRHAAV